MVKTQANKPKANAILANETMTDTNVTSAIVEEFTQLVETDKEYDLKELKQILSDIYKSKTTGKPKAKATKKTDGEPKKPKATKKTKEEAEDKPKRAPTAYNLFIKQRIIALKDEQPDVPAKERLTVAASEWKSLSQEEKDQYKPIVEA